MYKTSTYTVRAFVPLLRTAACRIAILIIGPLAASFLAAIRNFCRRLTPSSVLSTGEVNSPNHRFTVIQVDMDVFKQHGAFVDKDPDRQRKTPEGHDVDRLLTGS